MITNATTTAGNHESRLNMSALGHALTPIVLQSEDDLSIGGQHAEETTSIRRKLEWETEDPD